MQSYPTRQVRSRVFPQPGDPIGKKGKGKPPASSGGASRHRLQSAPGHTIRVAARFRFATAIGRTRRKFQSMPSNSRPAVCQARKSASYSSVLEARGGGGRSGGSQSLRWRRIFSMTEEFSMKLTTRNGPEHFGHMSGSGHQTLRIKRAQARLRWRRKSS